MYDITQIVDGIKYTIYFFGSFAGMTHPFTPVDPIEFDAIHSPIAKYNQSVYYQGWYTDTKNGPLLDKFIKIKLLGSPMKLNCNVITKPGIYYNRLEKVGDDWFVKEPLSPDALLKENHYLRYVVNKQGELSSADHIYSSITDSYIYTYNKDGVLIDVDTKVYDLPDRIPDL